MRVPSLRVSVRLPLALVGSAIVVAVGVGLASYLLAADLLSAQARQNLSTIAFERANQMSGLLSDIRSDVLSTARASGTVSAITGFANAWAAMDRAPDAGGATTVLQQAFFGAASSGGRIDIDKIKGLPPTYGITHSMYQPVFRKQTLERGYYDVYLFDLKGHLVYSARKADDYATGFAADDPGPFAASQLGVVYQAASAASDDSLSFADFAPYEPAGGAPLAFFAAPVLDATKLRVGIAAFALSESAFQGLLNRQGLGETGDVILVGPDGLARSDSTFTEANDVLQPTVFDPVIAATIEGGIAGSTEVMFNGQTVIAAGAPVVVADQHSWGFVAVMDKSEVFAGVTWLLTLMSVVGGGLLAVVGILGWLFGNSFSRPIAQITNVMNTLAAGDLDVQIAGGERTDEFGEMARAVEVFRANAHEIKETAANEHSASEKRRADRLAMMGELLRAFGEVVDAAAKGDFSHRVEAAFADDQLNTLAASVNNLVAVVEGGLSETGTVLSLLAEADLRGRVTGEYYGAFQRLKDDTNRVCDRLTQIASNLRGTSSNLKAATSEILLGANDLSERTTRQSAAIEETSAALERLSGTVMDNAKRADEASVKAAQTRDSAELGKAVMDDAIIAMNGIADASQKISNIVGMIDDIAFQTNLLALNASVEAARAGDAGKGFAVVAVEVRRLAQSAASASSEVKALIELSAESVAAGSKLVSDAGHKLFQMLDAAGQSSQLMQNMALANRQQASAIAEVSSAMVSLDEMTQHNAALVEQTNVTIEQAEAQAAELDRVVDVFSTGADVERAAA